MNVLIILIHSNVSLNQFYIYNIYIYYSKQCPKKSLASSDNPSGIGGASPFPTLIMIAN